jgi:hypothetical protein
VWGFAKNVTAKELEPRSGKDAPAPGFVNDSPTHPLFFVSVASKRVRSSVSPLFATHSESSVSAETKGVGLHQTGAR